MRFPDFLVGLADAAAWPLVVLVLILILKKPLLELIPLIENIRYRNFEISFNRRLANVELQFGFRRTFYGHDRVLFKVMQDASAHPRGAIIEAWVEIEKAMVELQRTSEIEMRPWRTRSYAQLARVLLESEMINSELAEAIRELWTMRNQAAHASELAITEDLALRYVALASRVISELRETIQNRSRSR